MSKSVFTLLFVLVILSSAYSQVLWEETFDEPAGSTTGVATGSLGAGSWSSTPGNSSYSVQGGAFRANNTGSEGVLTTNVMDISSAGYAIIDLSFFAIGLVDADETL